MGIYGTCIECEGNKTRGAHLVCDPCWNRELHPYAKGLPDVSREEIPRYRVVRGGVLLGISTGRVGNAAQVWESNEMLPLPTEDTSYLPLFDLGGVKIPDCTCASCWHKAHPRWATHSEY